MSVITMLGWIDTAILLIVILAAVDGSRQVTWKDEPWRAITYYGLAVGTAGYLGYRQFNTFGEAFFTMVMHLGIMCYAVLHLIRRAREARSHGRVLRGHHQWHF